MNKQPERRFVFSLPPVTLSVSSLWPDGDAPVDPTVADVEELINGYNCGDLIKEWALWDIFDLEIEQVRTKELNDE